MVVICIKDVMVITSFKAQTIIKFKCMEEKGGTIWKYEQLSNKVNWKGRNWNIKTIKKAGNVEHLRRSRKSPGWVDGWVNGWVGVRAILRSAYSNEKVN